MWKSVLENIRKELMPKMWTFYNFYIKFIQNYLSQ